MSENNKPPIARVNLHPIHANIWRKEGKEGEAFYSTTIERRYKDKDGKWKSASSFNADELLLVSKVADLAHTEVMRLRAADRPVRPTEQAEAEAA